MFYCRSLPEGKLTLEFSHIGYSLQSIEVIVSGGTTSRVNVALEERVRQLEPVEIRDELIEKVPYIRATVLREEIERSSARDIGDFIRTEPNVSGIRKGGIALDPVVRGFRFGQLNVQADNGMRIEGGCPNRMDPTAAHIEIEEIERIEVVKGPYALRYGPSMGGVVNMQTTRPGPYEDFQVHVKGLKGYESNWNGDKEYLAVSGGDQHYFFRLSGSKKNFGNYSDGNGDVVQSSFNRYSYKAQVGAIPFRNHEILLAYEKSKGRNVDYPALPMDERTDDTELWSLDYQANALGKVLHSLKLKLYRSDVMHVMDNKERPFSDTVAAVSSINALNQGARLEAGFFLGSGRLSAGVDYEHIDKDGDRVKNLIMQPTYPIFTEQLWNKALITNLGVFAEYRRLMEATEIVLAVRADMNEAGSEDILIKKMTNVIYTSNDNGSSFTNFSFSAGMNHQLNKNLKVSLALGRGVRSPDMVERFVTLLPIGYDQFDYLGNPKLEPEANHQADLTLEYAHPQWGALTLNGFFSYITDFITGRRLPPSEQVTLSADVLGVKEFYNAKDATLRGFEFTYHTPADLPVKVKLIAAYTHGVLGEATAYVRNESGAITGETYLTDDAMPEIPPLEGTVDISWPIRGGQLVPRISYRLVAAQKHISTSYEEDETPGFSVLNLGVNYRFNDYVSLSGGVNNILDVAYYEHLNRRIIGSKGNFFEPGRIFFLNLMLDI